MSGDTCPGCLGTGRDWVCLGTGYACPEAKTGVCDRCHGSGRCDLCDAPYLMTEAGVERGHGLSHQMARRVLVIDDQDGILEMLTLWFEDDPRCLSVTTATSAESAFLLLAEDSPDAIICDFQLGHATSEAYLPGLRSAAPSARIVIYTCDPALAQRAGVLDQGADLVLDKVRVPIDEVVDVAMRAALVG